MYQIFLIKNKAYPQEKYDWEVLGVYSNLHYAQEDLVMYKESYGPSYTIWIAKKAK